MDKRRRIPVYAVAGALLLGGAGAAVAATRSGEQRAVGAGNALTVTPLRNGTGLYPRVVRLAHSGSANGRVIASVVTFSGNAGIGSVYESDDAGKTFRQIGSVADPSGSGGKGTCCGTLYELPKKVGANPAGTLLWAAAFGKNVKPDRRMTIRLWRSLDHGRTWSYLSTIAKAKNTGGLWEPELTVSSDGRLVAFYSDETDSRHSQKIVRARSSDGRKWSAPTNTVSLAAKAERPGMPVVRRLPNGHYAMSYELCGSHKCEVRLRTSANGWSWGEATALGTRPAVGGRHFAHAPTIAARPDGSLLLVGQMLVDASGKAAPGNGRTLFVGAKGGTGTWRAVTAPVAVPDAKNEYCPNYSSALLPATTGTSVLEIATDKAGKLCVPYFATAATG
ncbi:sialidase family protein [Actinoallomurus acanthiterrae]